MPSPTTRRLAAWAESVGPSAIQELLQLTSTRPNILSFALGLPAPELFPTEDLVRVAREVLERDPRALQYESPLRRLKSHVVQLMAMRGVACTEEEVFLANGAQQAMSLAMRLFVEPGDSIIVESRVFTGFQQLASTCGARAFIVETDPASGIDVDAVRQICEREQPRLLYAISDGHNPLGVSTSDEKRGALVSLAKQHRFVILEDDSYGLLGYDPKGAILPLVARDRDVVVYVGSFSKILGPALRVGWLVAPPELAPALAVAKEAADVDTATLGHRLVAGYLASGSFDAHLQRIRSVYTRRRDAMLEALAAAFPEEARWTRPRHGMFIWSDLPESCDERALLAEVIGDESVAFLPGRAFYTGAEECTPGMRLSFASRSEDEIHDGIRRLGRVVKNHCRSRRV